MKLLFSILFLFVVLISYAEKPRETNSFYSKDSTFLLKITKTTFDSTFVEDGEFSYYDYNRIEDIWSLYNLKDSTIIYEFSDCSLYFQTAVISDDGMSIIIVDDYIPINPDFIETSVVKFYKHGVLKKEYFLFDIIEKLSNCSFSTGGFSWCFDFWINQDQKFVIQTYEFKELTFDISLGTLIDKKYFEGIDDRTKILYGKVEGLGQGTYLIKVDNVINGKVSRLKPYKFSSDLKLSYGYQTVVINDGEYFTETGINLDHFFLNSGSFWTLYKK
ncbi:MAG: hypothetical protein H6600_06995 [Flavobacteriales bacterium]|nr:hypothetical protein [Flavobacteriales bacterium]